MNRFLGVELPIIQAPMAGVQLGAMAAAVSGAGGLGSLPAAMLDAESLRRELRLLDPATTNVNFFCHVPPQPDPVREEAWLKRLEPYYRELGAVPAQGQGRAPFDAAAAEVLEDLKPAVVSFHFGLPAAPLLERVKKTGAKILSSATTLAEGRWLEAHGVDAVIAQGTEAGGHRGHFLSDDLSLQLPAFELLTELVKALRVPVIAAGGIADAAGVRRALELGAIAAQVGTAYLLTKEATTSAVHRAALKRGGPTEVTNVFTGRPARGLVNRFMREQGPLSADVPAFPRAAAAVQPLRAKAEAAGSGDFSPLWSGQNARCPEVGAAELTRDLGT